MRTIHPHSEECCKSELDLFSVPPTQTSIDESHWTSVNPISAVSTPEAPIEFIIPSSGDLFLDPSSIFLYIKAAIKTTDGQSLPTQAAVYPECNILHSLFSHCEVYLNETNITPSSGYYPYRAYLETLLNYTSDAKDTHLRAAGFYTRLHTLSLASRFTNSENKEFDCYGRLHGDIFQQGRLILNGMDMRIKLSRSPASFCIKAADSYTLPDSAIYPDILETYLYIRRVKLSPSKHMAIERQLLATTAKYPLKRVVTKMFTVGAGLTSAHIDNIVLGNLPYRVIFGLLEHSTINGVYKKTGLLFKHQNLKQISVYINGSVLGRPLDCRFASGTSTLPLTSRIYHNLFTGSGFDLQTGNGITEEDFSGTYCLHPFDLTADQCGDANDHLNPIKQGTLSVNLVFGKATSTTLSLFCYMEFSNVIEIDKSRNILYDY